MPTTLSAIDHVAGGTRLESATYDTNYIVDPDVLFGSPENAAKITTSCSHDVFVRGTLCGDISVIKLSDHRQDALARRGWQEAPQPSCWPISKPVPC